MNNKCNETLNIRIPSELLNNLKDIASTKGISYSQLIRDVLKEFCEKGE